MTEENKDQIHFSAKALKNIARDKRWPKLCNNDCGAWVYYDFDTGVIRNAEYHKNDSDHSETCSVLKKAFMIAASLNWYPSYSFEEQALAFIKSAKEMYLVAVALEKSIEWRKAYNIQARLDWNTEKEKKSKEKQDKRKKGFGFEGFP